MNVTAKTFLAASTSPRINMGCVDSTEWSAAEDVYFVFEYETIVNSYEV